jgi:hypothetical protein
MPTLSVAEAVTVAVPATVAPLAGAVTDTPGGVVSAGGTPELEIVTVTTGEVARLPAPSRASAVSVWIPFATLVVSHAIVKGPLRSSAPTATPSSLNCTPATATLSAALADRLIVPVTVALLAGDDRTTVGGVVSVPPEGGSPGGVPDVVNDHSGPSAVMFAIVFETIFHV